MKEVEEYDLKGNARKENSFTKAKSKRIYYKGKALILIILGLVCIAFRNTINNIIQSAAQPGGLYIPANTVVLTKASGATVYTHTFQIYNGLLQSAAVQADPSCGCMHVSWRRAIIGPLNSKNLVVSVHYDGRIRNQEKAIAIRTNRSTKPFLFVFFLAPS